MTTTTTTAAPGSRPYLFGFHRDNPGKAGFTTDRPRRLPPKPTPRAADANHRRHVKQLGDTAPGFYAPDFLNDEWGE